jgi:hypothetical protein
LCVAPALPFSADESEIRTHADTRVLALTAFGKVGVLRLVITVINKQQSPITRIDTSPSPLVPYSYMHRIIDENTESHAHTHTHLSSAVAEPLRASQISGARLLHTHTRHHST